MGSVHRAPHKARLKADRADNRTWHPAGGTWQVSGRRVPRRLVWAAFPAAHAMFPAGPTAGQAPPPADGKGGGPPGTGPAWPASHPMFCSQSLECPGTRSSAPWGDTGAISLISSLDRFLLHSSSGLGRLPAPLLPVPASLCLSLCWQLRAMQLGERGKWGGRRVLSACLQWALGMPPNPFSANPFPAVSTHKLLCL